MSEWSEVVAGAIGGGLVLAIQAFVSRYTGQRDADKIFGWLTEEAAKPGNFESRTTRAIAKAVSMDPARVVHICYNDVRIDPVIGERDDLWRLSGKT
ncbi:hypothetical protein [Pseudomonas sp. 2(2015)]|uniref:hypothetical protein n=1 Tax=Pseudomonas sp. 2(2015) TaxID=1619950 RepID=UPI0005EBA4B2|nr:hypothetical protein [Pseudomonas sp. 2(2015)]KJK14856.1 hypothetical protein UB48_23980 [Pseudomonas sp. 2(2015)]